MTAKEDRSMAATETVQIAPADGRILIDATGSMLDSFRRELIDSMKSWDGIDSDVYAPLSGLVAQVDDAMAALRGSQVGVPAEHFEDGSGLR
jgi:hypothetical protein